MTTRRTSLTLGAAGLVAGLALGITGFARAADPTPSPSAGGDQQLQDPRPHHRPHHPGGPLGRFRGEHHGGYAGLVTAIDSDSLTLRTPRGSETVGLTGDTAYYVGKAKASRTVVEKGAVVHVRLADPRSASKVASVVSVVPAHIAGWVTEIGSSSLTVKDTDGFTRTIRTSSGTTYEKDGAKSTRSALTVGTFVMAVGKVAEDGTTLKAERVATGRPGRDGKPGLRHPMGAPPEDAPQT